MTFINHDPFDQLPNPRGLDPLYFDRRRSIDAALSYSGSDATAVSRVIDVGANVGRSVEEFLEWYPKCSVLAFEPLPEAFAKLNAALQSSEYLNSRAFTRQVGLSNASGMQTLFSSKLQSTNSSFSKINSSATTVSSHRGLNQNVKSSFELDDPDDSYQVVVPVETLDTHLRKEEPAVAAWVDGVDILKIDAQSWDMYVLMGATATLSGTRVVLLEWQFDDIYGPPKPLHVLDRFMADHGFKLWDFAHIYKDLKSLRTLWVDVIYVKVISDR